MKKKYTQGFTLIELLVVIAIIGILSSVVLVSLNTARNKGKDTRVISDVQQLRTQVEADSNGNYDTSFSGVNAFVSTGNYATLTGDATTNGGAINVVTTSSGGHYTAYSIYGKLVSQSTATYFCISSTGKTNPAMTTNTGSDCN